MEDVNRRALITGLACLIASPAIVRASSLMPIRAFQWGTTSRWFVMSADQARIRALVTISFQLADHEYVQSGYLIMPLERT